MQLFNAITAAASCKAMTDLLEQGHIERLVNSVHGNKNATPLMKAATVGRVDMVCVLIGYGADVNAVNRDNKTALHMATLEEVRGGSTDGTPSPYQ